jgi:hypothetical protein
LEPTEAGFDQGVVTVSVTMRLAHGTRQQPFTTTYDITLLRAGGAWRVASFGAQP